MNEVSKNRRSVGNFKAGLMIWWRYFIIAVLVFFVAFPLLGDFFDAIPFTSIVSTVLLLMLLLLGIWWGAKALHKKVGVNSYNPVRISLFAVLPTTILHLIFLFLFSAGISGAFGGIAIFPIAGLFGMLITDAIVLFVFVFVVLKIFDRTNNNTVPPAENTDT